MNLVSHTNNIREIKYVYEHILMVNAIEFTDDVRDMSMFGYSGPGYNPNHYEPERLYGRSLVLDYCYNNNTTQNQIVHSVTFKSFEHYDLHNQKYICLKSNGLYYVYFDILNIDHQPTYSYYTSTNETNRIREHCFMAKELYIYNDIPKIIKFLGEMENDNKL